MGLAAFVALVRKDLQLFFSDRRAVILTFAVPIAIASFFGSIFSGTAATTPSRRRSRSPSSIVTAARSRRAIVSGIQADRSLATSTPPLEEARTAVQKRRRRRRGDRAAGIWRRRGPRISVAGNQAAGRAAVRSVAQRGAGDGARHPHRSCDGGRRQGSVQRRAGPRDRGRDARSARYAAAMPADDARHAAQPAPVGAAAQSAVAARAAAAAAAITVPFDVKRRRRRRRRRQRAIQRLRALVCRAWGSSSCCSRRSSWAWASCSSASSGSGSDSAARRCRGSRCSRREARAARSSRC